MSQKIKIFFFTAFLTYSLVWGQLSFGFVGDGQNLNNGCFLITDNLMNQRTAVWYRNPIDFTQDFSVNFDLFFTDKDADGADGMTLVFRDRLVFNIGNAGGDLGYGGIFNSLAIEFDVWDNNPNFGNFDLPQDHISFLKNGVTNHNPIDPNFTQPPTIASATSENIEDGEFHNVLVEWNASSQTMSVSFDCVFRQSYNIDIVDEIFNDDPIGFFGFTGSTGGFFLRQELCLNSVSFIQQDFRLEDQTICLGETITSIDASFARSRGETYSWSSNNGTASISDTTIANPIFTPTTNTIYTVTITPECGDPIVESFEAIVNIPGNPGILATSTGSTNFCVNDTTTILTNGDAGGTWSSNSSSVSINSNGEVVANSAGNATITYRVSDCPNGFSTISISVSNPPNSGDISGVNQLCTTSNPIMLSSNGDSNGTWESSNEMIATINENTGLVTPLAAGNVEFVYTALSSNTCPNSTSAPFTITIVEDNLNAGNIIGPSNVCEDDTNIQLTSTGDADGVWTALTPNIAEIDSNSGEVSILSSGVARFQYTVQSGTPCPNSSVFELNISSIPIIQNIFVVGNSIEIIASGSSPLEYSINNVDFFENNTFENLPSGEYTVYVRNQNGLCSTTSANTGIFFIPNVITPNGDGINDVWQINFINTFPNATVSLYDRYGKAILDSVLVSGLNFTGTYLGRKLPSGTYWYVLKLNDSSSSEVRGSLLIKNF